MKKADLYDQDPPKRTGKSWFSKTVAWIHLWPSLISALILIFVCLTGTIVVYCDEVIDFVNRDVLHVPEVKAQRLPFETLLREFKEAYPQRRNPGYAVTYKDPTRSVKYNSFDKKKGLRFVYQDPYTGKILKDDGTIYFFYITAHLHNSLLLNTPGRWIVDIATVIFLIELITGLILWWPAKWTRTTREQSFKIKWKAKIKRLNYDLHNVLGFYAFSISLVLTVTGLIIAFKPLAAFTIKTFGGDPSHKFEKSLPQFDTTKAAASIDYAINKSFQRDPGATAIQIGTFKIDSSGYYQIAVGSQIGLKSYVGKPYIIDRYTGEPVKLTSEARLHEVVENGYWMLHMGTWMGWVGKLVTFTGGLICTSLPVTGFFIWWNRRKKPGKRKKPNLKSSGTGSGNVGFVPRTALKKTLANQPD